MAIPSSQAAADWVQRELESTSWVPLRDVLFSAVRQKLTLKREQELWEYVETNLPFVAEHLRDIVADREIDGAVPTFEIDNEPSPYIRRSGSVTPQVVSRLRRIDPFQLEDICAKILRALGASSYTTQRTNDGGVDFVAVRFKIVPLALTIPTACTAAVIGQAKRYKDGNSISETRLREFVGSGTLKRHQMNSEHNIGPLAPVLFAFWTTSDFDYGAKRYAREMGLWYMDGPTLANYVVALGLESTVMSLPEVLVPANGQDTALPPEPLAPRDEVQADLANSGTA